MISNSKNQGNDLKFRYITSFAKGFKYKHTLNKFFIADFLRILKNLLKIDFLHLWNNLLHTLRKLFFNITNSCGIQILKAKVEIFMT